MIEYKDDAIDQRGRLGVTKGEVGKGQFAKLVFTKDECWVVRADGKRDAVKGQTNCGFKSWTTKAGKVGHEIELTAFGGSDGGDAEVKYVGVVKVGEGKLFLCWNEGGATTPNGKKSPTKFESDGMMNLFVCERLSDTPEAKPKKSNAIRTRKCHSSVGAWMSHLFQRQTTPSLLTHRRGTLARRPFPVPVSLVRGEHSPPRAEPTRGRPAHPRFGPIVSKCRRDTRDPVSSRVRLGHQTGVEHAAISDARAQARIPVTTSPWTSVRRKSRPACRYVSFLWSRPSRCSMVACRSWKWTLSVSA